MSFEQKRNRNIHCSVHDFEKLNSRKDFEDFDGLREEKDRQNIGLGSFYLNICLFEQERNRTSMNQTMIVKS
jgi:hypothetical protein